MDEMSKILNRVNWGSQKLNTIRKDSAGEIGEEGVDDLIFHFRNRSKPEYLFETNLMEGLEDELLIKDADDVLNHEVFGHKFDGEIDWHFNPTTETSRDNEWSWSLYRHIYWQPLARAYVRTGEEKYAKEFVDQLKSFARDWPADNFLADPEYGSTLPYFPGHAWRTIETGIRIYTTWLPCFIAFRSSPSWDREGWMIYLNLIHDHAEFLLGNYSNHKSSSNWLTMESSALMQMGIMFPELEGADRWFRTGYQRAMHELKYSFDNDGIHMERTPIYHLVSLIAFMQACRLCTINGIPVPPYGLPILEKGGEFIMKLVKPDFSTPMIGDADRNDLLGRRSDTSVYEGMNLTFDPLDLNEMRGFFRQLHEMTGREDFLYFATGRREGNPPEKRDFAFTDAGIYVMRTGWEKESSYFLMHGIQLERGERSTHSHNDQGHLELQIRGEDVLIDSGRYIYNSSCWKEWRHYFLSAKAHNTIYIDDHEMGTVPIPGISRIRGVRTHCHRFEENERYSIIDLSHNGYAFRDDPIFHRRKTIRLKGDVYVIDDQLTGLGLDEHDIRLYFNFAPGELEELAAGKYLYTNDAGSRFSVSSVLESGFNGSILKGSEDPIGGWASFGYSVREPIPQLCLSCKGPVPLRFVTVIAPADSPYEAEAHGEMIRIRAGEISLKLIGDRIELQ